MIWIILLALNLLWLIVLLVIISGLDNCGKFQIPNFDDTNDFQSGCQLLDVDCKQNRVDLQRNKHPALLPYHSADMDTDA